jgi:transposase
MDESGVNLAMTRRLGRAPRGERVGGTLPQNYGANLTMMAARSRRGLGATVTMEGATDTDAFQAYVEQLLGPTLRPGDMVVLGNVSAHTIARVRDALESRAARVVDLPPASPGLSPSAQGRSKVKTSLRTAQARTREALEAGTQQALTTITTADARRGFT